MNPLFLEIMIWHYSRKTRYGGTAALAEPQQKQIKTAVDQKMLQPMISSDKEKVTATTMAYEITARGNVYVKSLLNVGFPLQAWESNYPMAAK